MFWLRFSEVNDSQIWHSLVKSNLSFKGLLCMWVKHFQYEHIFNMNMLNWETELNYKRIFFLSFALVSSGHLRNRLKAGKMNPTIYAILGEGGIVFLPPDLCNESLIALLWWLFSLIREQIPPNILNNQNIISHLNVLGSHHLTSWPWRLTSPNERWTNLSWFFTSPNRQEFWKVVSLSCKIAMIIHSCSSFESPSLSFPRLHLLTSSASLGAEIEQRVTQNWFFIQVPP